MVGIAEDKSDAYQNICTRSSINPANFIVLLRKGNIHFIQNILYRMIAIFEKIYFWEIIILTISEYYITTALFNILLKEKSNLYVR